MKKIATILIAATVLLGTGCGAVDLTAHPNGVVAASGDPLVLEEIETILRNATLGDDEKRAGLRDLGLEDEKLIDALLGL